jgi:bifunctional DNA-binding transcriptional regulator/antitoxin component of YhaV-PrlF toxin-antitoxin module
MWIKNTGTRIIGKNKSQEESYLVVNTLEKNPALRVSEKARQYVGWGKHDYVNIYVDRTKIMLMKDNNAREFPVRIYENKNRKYGFNIYGMPIKETLKTMGWDTQKDYPVEVREFQGEKCLVCYKDELSSIHDLAHMKVRNL